jgi:hypothetical protein
LPVFQALGVTPIPTFCEVSIVTAVVPADCKVSAVAAALESELIVGVVMVGDVPNTLAPVPVIVVVEM